MAKLALRFVHTKDESATPVSGHIYKKKGEEIHILVIPKTVEQVRDFLLAAAETVKGVRRIRLENRTNEVIEMPESGWTAPANLRVTVSDPRAAL